MSVLGTALLNYTINCNLFSLGFWSHIHSGIAQPDPWTKVIVHLYFEETGSADNWVLHSGGRPWGPCSCLAIQIVFYHLVSDDELPGIVECDAHYSIVLPTKESPCYRVTKWRWSPTTVRLILFYFIFHSYCVALRNFNFTPSREQFVSFTELSFGANLLLSLWAGINVNQVTAHYQDTRQEHPCLISAVAYWPNPN